MLTYFPIATGTTFHQPLADDFVPRPLTPIQDLIDALHRRRMRVWLPDLVSSVLGLVPSRCEQTEIPDSGGCPAPDSPGFALRSL